MNALRQVTLRIESRPSFMAGAESGSKLSPKRKVAGLEGSHHGEGSDAAKAMHFEKTTNRCWP